MLDRVRLVASELATNALLHAGTDFTVTLTKLGDRLVVEVEDQVQDQVPGLTGMAAARQVRAMSAATSGRGLELVSVLSREWGVNTDRPGRKTVWASFPETGGVVAPVRQG
jgi:anti-sigma regulatory factor (Ser/Thr protein kinase)